MFYGFVFVKAFFLAAPSCRYTMMLYEYTPDKSDVRSPRFCSKFMNLA